MFGRKKYKHSVSIADKEWIEKNMGWFLEVFGLHRMNEQPFYLPVKEQFPYTNLSDGDQFQQLFEQLCNSWQIDANDIVVKFFDDLKSKQWNTWVPGGEITEPGGLYYKSYSPGEKRYNIRLAKSNLGNSQLLISVLAHELAHVKLLGGNFIKVTDADMEPLTDLATIFYGFGIMVANSCQTKNAYWIGRSGYLPNEIISYANALICYIAGHKADDYIALLNTNTKALFKQDYEYLINTNDTQLIPPEITRIENKYRNNKQIADGFNNKNFKAVIEACNKILDKAPSNYSAYNNIGYALLMQKKYEDAITNFTKAIDLEPYWDYPYNNRGYCRLQLGDLDNAFPDLHSSYEMNPANSFSWRNLGAYYLATKEFDKALSYFEEAEKIDPKTELINFYLGHAHTKLHNQEKAMQYFKQSRALNEHNDSLLPGL